MKLFVLSAVTVVWFICLLNDDNKVASLSLEGVKNKTGDVAKLAGNVAKAVVEKVPDLIPTPENLYNIGKQTLVGLPFELLIAGIDKLCSIALSANNATESYKQPNISEMNYVLITADGDNISVPILKPLLLWKHDKFDPKRKVVVLVTGWTTDINATNEAADVLAEAYKSRGDVNFILIDTARYVDTLYAWSAFNTNELGEGLGDGLSELINIVPMENIHLMGHSLGSHIAGAAGRRFQVKTNGKMLPRITGFDPAKPCFKEGESLGGLSRGDAEFVDIIHSDSGGLGKSDPIGDADFYPNGIVSLMPGCLTIFCSHSRAWEYFAESVYKGNENNFLAKKCGSLHSYEINACIMNEVPMGYACPKNVKGNFFLKTNTKTPFGKRHGDAKQEDSESQQSSTMKGEDSTEMGQQSDQTSTTEAQNFKQGSSNTENYEEQSDSTTNAQGQESKGKAFKPISSAASKLKGLFS